MGYPRRGSTPETVLRGASESGGEGLFVFFFLSEGLGRGAADGRAKTLRGKVFPRREKTGESSGKGKGSASRYRDVPDLEAGPEDDAEEVKRWEMEEQQVSTQPVQPSLARMHVDPPRR